MPFPRFCFALFLFFVFPPSSGSAAVQTVLHVAPTGNDANADTEAQPLATVDGARRAVRALLSQMTGDVVVILHGGVYPIKNTVVFGPEDSGAGRHKVMYRAARDEKPIISGGIPVTGWEPDEKGRWKAPAPVNDFRQLYVGGVRATRARGEKPAGLELFGEDGYTTTAVEMADWRNPGDMELCYLVVWAHTRCKIRAIHREGNKAVITMLQPHFSHAKAKEGVNIVNTNHVDAIYLENALELLDEPGEWYLDRAAETVYYLPRPGEDMTSVEAIAPAVETLLELRGTLDRPVENLTFEGITFAHGGWLRPSRIGFVDVQANFVLDWKKPFFRNTGLTAVHNEHIKSPSNIVCRAAKSVDFHRCTFTRLGSGGIDLESGSQDNTIAGCRFHDISGSAIQVGDVLKNDHHPDDPRMIVKNNAVVNNAIHDCGVEFWGSVGVFLGYTEGTVVAHNEITRLPYSGISAGWGWGEEDAGGGNPNYQQPFKYDTPTPARNNRIEWNHIHDVMRKTDDGAAIYTLGNQPGTIIRGNHVHDCKNPTSRRGWSQGIYLDEGSGHIEVTRNLVHGVKPMHFNNMVQDRKATCRVHDNYFGIRPAGSTCCPGLVANAMACDGASVFLEVPHASALEPEKLTLEAWIKLSEYPAGEDARRWIVNKNTHELAESHYALAIDGKKPAAYLNIGGGLANSHEAVGGDLLKLNQWHQLAMTYDGSVLRTYLDGREVASKTVRKQRVPGTTSLCIGRRQDGSFWFHGAIDEARLHDRALSPDEILANFRALTRGEKEPPGQRTARGLVGYWNMDVPAKTIEQVQKIVETAGLEMPYRYLGAFEK